MDVWETFGIKTLSPSQLTKWAQDRGQWYVSARKKVYDDAGPSAWRGNAVEAGLYASIMGKPNADRVAHDLFQLSEETYLTAQQGVLPEKVEEKIEEERAVISITLERAIAGWEKETFGKAKAYQVKTECFLPGTRVQMFGKPDFALEVYPCCVDLKTANQLPSVSKETGRASPKIEHAIAASIYAHARKETLAYIFYVSTAGNPKDTYRLIKLDASEIAFYVRAAAEIVKQIEATLLAAIAMSEFEIVSAEDALAQLCRPNLLAQGGGLFPIWKEDYTHRALEAVPLWK